MASLLSLLVLAILLPLAAADGRSGMAEEELSALFVVVGALLEDSSWAQLHPHPCTDTPWPGVQCEMLQKVDAFFHVTKLHIGPDLASPPCKPTPTLSHSLLKLPFLKTLSLFSCFLNHSNSTLPASLFTNGSSLEQLVVVSNPGLSGLIPPTIANCRSLRVLSLSQNNLQGEIPREIGELGKLQQLDLSYNHITGQIPDEIGGLTGLTILDLSWNRLQGNLSSSIGKLGSLEKIDLSSNQLTGKIPIEMGQLHKLVLLDLSRNSLTGPIPETLSGLKDLEYFLMENNPISTGVPLFLGSLNKLAVVGLSGCGLLGPIPVWFESLVNLTALALDRNRLNGSVPKSLDALPNLGQLNLSQNLLSGEIAFGEEFVSRLGKRLDVRDNEGLCANSHLYFAAPPCLDSPADSANSNSTNVGLQSATGIPVQDSTSSSGKGLELQISPWCLCLGILLGFLEGIMW